MGNCNEFYFVLEKGEIQFKSHKHIAVTKMGTILFEQIY